MMHIFSMKHKTKQLGITKIVDAPLLYLPMSQHIGKTAVAVVSPGDYVFKYQIIGRGAGTFSSNIHSPVSGKVKEIILHPISDDMKATTIVIENDFLEKEAPEKEFGEVDKLTSKAILSIIENAGIVGEGGAQFPTHVKYALEGSEIDTFILNGTECEPYLTNDYTLMKEKPEYVLKAAIAVNRILGAKEIVLAIEKQNADLVAIFQPLFEKEEYRNIRIKLLPDQYPQGGELQLIKSVTGKELRKGSLPRNFGIIVSNVGTMGAIYNALYEGRPLIDRIVTVSGEKSKQYGNFLVKLGTPISHILKLQNMTSLAEDCTLVMGGPMMGKNVSDMSIPIIKGTSAVLFFEKKKIVRNNCISCGYCVDVCPMRLMPMMFAEIYQNKKFAKLKEYSLNECIKCAACEYICPSDVPLMEGIKEGKKELIKMINDADRDK